MKEVKLINEFAKVEVDKGVYLTVIKLDGIYYLDKTDYNISKYMVKTEIKGGVKRISTINNYAKQYGVKFMEEK